MNRLAGVLLVVVVVVVMVMMVVVFSLEMLNLRYFGDWVYMYWLESCIFTL